MRMKSITIPRETKPMISQIPYLLPSSPGLYGIGGGSKGVTEVPGSESLLGANDIIPFCRLKDPVSYLMKLYPKIIDTLSD